MQQRSGLQSIRVWVLGMALFPFVFLVLILGAFLRLETDAESVASMAQHSGVVLEQLHRAQTDVARTQSAIGRYLQTGSSQAAEDFRRSDAFVDADAARLRALVADNPIQENLATELAADVKRQEDGFDVLASGMQHGNRTAIAAVSSDAIQTVLAQFQANEERLAEQRRTSSDRLWNQLRNGIIATIVGGILAAVTIGLLLSRRFVGRLRHLRDQAKAFASSGTMPQKTGGNDEIAELSEALAEMASQVTERSDALERYRLLAELAHDGIIFMRRSDGRIVEANHAAVELYGYAHDELLQMSGFDLRSPAAAAANFPIPTDRSFSLQFESEHRKKDGSTFPVDVSVESAHLKGQLMVLAIVRDISPRREAEVTIRAALAQANEASRLKSEFVATMSHEIRTPMNGVIGMTELLLDSDLSPSQREFALTARDSAHSLLDVINNILDFSKIEAGKVETEITEFDLIAKVEGVASMLGAQAHKKGISLVTYVDPTIPSRLLGDAMRLRQVLVNLVGNSVKFTSEGSVAVVVEPEQSFHETVRLRFAVCDTGIGISREALPRLFQAFTQSDGSTTRRFGGTGLGLAISKRLVDIMGGSLEVESEIDVGSTFSFSLSFRVASSEKRPARRQLDDLRAIVVDDDVMSRDILSRYLVSWGVRTSVAESAEEAFAMMMEGARKGEAFDLGVVDFRMPGGDGLELGRRVKREPLVAGTNLLLVTAFDAPQQGSNAIESGFTAYLTKPVRQSQLYDAILDSVLGGSRPVEKAEQRVRSAQNGARILLVEDNEVNRQVFMRQLERLGYSADFASDGREALERIAGGSFDLVFMDCQMPVMDGFQATRAIRKIESRTGKHIPIVALTANALARDRDECLAAGMDDYLAKPVGMNDVAAKLDTWLLDGAKPRVLNRQRMSDIYGDDEHGLREFFASAIATVRERCDRLARTLDRKEAEELAHDIKGAAGNIGAEELAAEAQALEYALRDSAPMPSTADLLAALSRLEEAVAAASPSGDRSS